MHQAMEVPQAERKEALEFIDLFDVPFKRIFSFFSTQRTDTEKNDLGRHLVQEVRSERCREELTA